ncbi:hypothetical protein Tco_0094097 [Tanacetum coccineum]
MWLTAEEEEQLLRDEEELKEIEEEEILRKFDQLYKEWDGSFGDYSPYDYALHCCFLRTMMNTRVRQSGNFLKLADTSGGGGGVSGLTGDEDPTDDVGDEGLIGDVGGVSGLTGGSVSLGDVGGDVSQPFWLEVSIITPVKYELTDSES